MHPFLVPGEWLVTGRFFDPSGGESLTAGATVVETTEQFPEILHIVVDMREVSPDGRGAPQKTSYHLEIVGTNRVTFRMDSIALGTILVGKGTFSDRALILTYQSSDQRFVGFESFTVMADDRLLASGAFLADGAQVKIWEVSLECVPTTSP